MSAAYGSRSDALVFYQRVYPLARDFQQTCCLRGRRPLLLKPVYLDPAHVSEAMLLFGEKNVPEKFEDRIPGPENYVSQNLGFTGQL